MHTIGSINFADQILDTSSKRTYPELPESKIFLAKFDHIPTHENTGFTVKHPSYVTSK
jgi:hypothetical protein